MEYLQLGALSVHIIAGYLALTSGLLVMILKKGNNRHILLGHWFYYTMLLVCISALLLSVIKSNAFLLHIAIFVGYQNHAGRRSVQDKTLRASWIDWIILMAATINGAFMVMTGNIVLTVFGAISLFLVSGDVRTQWLLSKGKGLARQAWLKRHIGMMMGAYIGAITAFVVVNVYVEHYGWVLWLAPTAILVPLMQVWTYRFTRIAAPKSMS